MGQNRSDQRDWKKDQRIRREVLEEEKEHAPERDDYEPRYKNLNRDQARGDSDRTGRRHDENTGT